MSPNMLQADGPATQNDAILFTAMVPTGYHTATQTYDSISIDTAGVDQLAVTATSVERWTEETGRESTIVSNIPGREAIRWAEAPVASPNGRWLAYLREDHGRDRIWLHTLVNRSVEIQFSHFQSLTYWRCRFYQMVPLFSPLNPMVDTQNFFSRTRQEQSASWVLKKLGIRLSLQMAIG
jgi:hypothetical protein